MGLSIIFFGKKNPINNNNIPIGIIKNFDELPNKTDTFEEILNLLTNFNINPTKIIIRDTINNIFEYHFILKKLVLSKL